MIREIARVPLFPQRVLEHLERLTDIAGTLLDSQTHQRRTLDSVDEKIASVAADASHIPAVREVLDAIRADVNRLEERIVRIEREVRELSGEVDKVVPGKEDAGPMTRVRDALTGG